MKLFDILKKQSNSSESAQTYMPVFNGSIEHGLPAPVVFDYTNLNLKIVTKYLYKLYIIRTVWNDGANNITVDFSLDCSRKSDLETIRFEMSFLDNTSRDVCANKSKYVGDGETIYYMDKKTVYKEYTMRIKLTNGDIYTPDCKISGNSILFVRSNFYKFFPQGKIAKIAFESSHSPRIVFSMQEYDFEQVMQTAFDELHQHVKSIPQIQELRQTSNTPQNSNDF